MIVLAAVLAAGCVRREAPVAQAAPQPSSELDALAYGGARAQAAPRAAAPVAATPVVATSAAAAQLGYTLDSGDKLRVVVFGQDGLTNSYNVDAGGSITMPLIGAVAARGLSTAELSAAIGARLRQGYIREPHVAVEIESYRPFFILGEVTYPGQYPYVANMTVETAVAIAGGYTPRALHGKAEISRMAGGQQIRRSAPVNTSVRPGDTITIDERWF
jgi:polysaccharide export outer membrane protein